MKPPIKYWGGKQSMLSDILPLIPEHSHYVEPFVGGGAVFFAKRKSSLETLNDTNGHIVNFYRVLQNEKAFKELKQKLSETLYSEAIKKEADAILIQPSNTSNSYYDVSSAWALFCALHSSFGSIIGSEFSYNIRDEIFSTKYSVLQKNINLLSEKYTERLRGCHVLQRDALDVIPKIDTENTFFYIDPPYIGASQGHYSGYTDSDFEQLLHILANLKGKFLLSSYTNDTLSTFVSANEWKQKHISILLHSARMHRKRIEVLTYNYICSQRDLF